MVQVRRQIWLPTAIFDFHRYRISPKLLEGILSKPYIWIRLNVYMCPPEIDSGLSINMAEPQPSLK